jgi:hypothetical protein
VTSRIQTLREKAAAGWAAAKPVAIGLAIGLIAGPILSGMAGFQVRSSTAHAAARAGIVEQQALFCHERARAERPETGGRLDWSRSYALAQRWAVMPGSTEPDSEVASACARKLSG